MHEFQTYAIGREMLHSICGPFFEIVENRNWLTVCEHTKNHESTAFFAGSNEMQRKGC
jgi:hypothetical protein